MNIRQERYKANRIKGMNQYNAARAAGYSESLARAHPERLERSVSVGICNELERAGLTDKYQADALEELARDKESNIRIKALKHISELKKQVNRQPSIDQSQHIHLTTVKALVDEANIIKRKRIEDTGIARSVEE